ncbi:MAG: adenylyltransferase/cytidyltransferase family protein, partial [Deltaproteobacteria bacterium]|nr:adenylyltransferase/cytidyltransferase family protein [Deltaproteobacteria bacterium]
MGKTVTLKRLLKELKGRRNKKIVFTNGCFDILHAGHVRYLKKAKA